MGRLGRESDCRKDGFHKFAPFSFVAKNRENQFDCPSLRKEKYQAKPGMMARGGFASAHPLGPSALYVTGWTKKGRNNQGEKFLYNPDLKKIFEAHESEITGNSQKRQRASRRGKILAGVEEGGDLETPSRDPEGSLFKRDRRGRWRGMSVTRSIRWRKLPAHDPVAGWKGENGIGKSKGYYWNRRREVRGHRGKGRIP